VDEIFAKFDKEFIQKLEESLKPIHLRTSKPIDKIYWDDSLKTSII
jgi:hypothetical protein